VEHVVFFTGADGAAQYRRTASLEEAVRVVEHLRNVEGVEDSRVFALDEVPLAFKTVYRVEIPGHTPSDPGVAPLPPMPAMPAELDAVAAVAEADAPAPEAEPAPVMAAVPGEQYVVQEQPEPAPNGRRGSGFFAR
jgi:hypothetical protein